MALRELERVTGTFCNRIYYEDDDGNLVERIMQKTSDEEVRGLLRENQQAARDFRPHSGGNIRRTASVPHELMLKWLHEAGIAGLGEEAMDYVVNKQLKDPENHYLLTVPTNYRMMRYG